VRPGGAGRVAFVAGAGQSLRSGAVLNRRLAALLAAVALAGLAATGCAEQSAAIRVDDATVSRSDFEDQLDLVYENEGFRNALFGGVTQDQLRAEGDPPGTYRQEFVGALASLHVQFLVVGRILDDEGLEVSDDARAQAEGVFEGAGGEGVPQDVLDQFIEGIAGTGTVQQELAGEALDAALQRVMDGSTIELDSRYGTWDAEQFTVVPPAGPAGGADTSEPEATDLPTG
jgi:hypothetical protein